MKFSLLAFLILATSSIFLIAAEYKDPEDGYLYVDSDGAAASYKPFKFFFSQKEIVEQDDVTETDIKFETTRIDGFIRNSEFLESAYYEENALDDKEKIKNKYREILRYLENCPSSDLGFSFDKIILSSTYWGAKQFTSSNFEQEKGDLYFAKKDVVGDLSHFIVRVNKKEQEAIGEITVDSLKQWQVNKLRRQLSLFERSISLYSAMSTFACKDPQILQRLKNASEGYKTSLDTKNMDSIICYNRELDSLFTGEFKDLYATFFTVCSEDKVVLCFCQTEDGKRLNQWEKSFFPESYALDQGYVELVGVNSGDSCGGAPKGYFAGIPLYKGCSIQTRPFVPGSISLFTNGQIIEGPAFPLLSGITIYAPDLLIS
jgi:hypothetical protein